MAKTETKIKVKPDTIIVEIAQCTRCGYRWVPEFEFDHYKKSKSDGCIKKPVACAHCHSPYYDKDRKNNNGSSK